MTYFNNNWKKFGEQHTYHLVENSPYPIWTSGALFFFVLKVIGCMHHHKCHMKAYVAFCLLLLILSLWFFDICKESKQWHGEKVELGLRCGMILFIVSEIMFFFSFFWAYFHSSVCPSIGIGCTWPPFAQKRVNPYGIPMANTFILLASGFSLTSAHKAIICKQRKIAINNLFLTIILGLVFTLLQGYEYKHLDFCIADNIFTSLFFLLTGFHGLHVIIGTVFLIVCFIRYLRKSIHYQRHFGFEAAAWYWHFVDVVWLLLYLIVYLWGQTL